MRRVRTKFNVRLIWDEVYKLLIDNGKGWKINISQWRNKKGDASSVILAIYDTDDIIIFSKRYFISNLPFVSSRCCNQYSDIAKDISTHCKSPTTINSALLTLNYIENRGILRYCKCMIPYVSGDEELVYWADCGIVNILNKPFTDSLSPYDVDSNYYLVDVSNISLAQDNK